MHNNNVLLIAVLVVICLLLGVLAFSYSKDLKKTELAFNEKKAVLVKENLDLKDRLDSLQKIISEKTESLTATAKEKSAVQEQLDALVEKNKELMTSYTAKLEVLSREKEALRKKVLNLDKSPVIERIKDILKKEENDNIRKVLEDVLNKLELIKEGKPVNLEPIVVTKNEVLTTSPVIEPAPQKEEKIEEARKVIEQQEKSGTILSVDRKNSLIVISLGRKEDVAEGYRCKILNNDEEIASAEVVSVRYRIAAAFIDNILGKHSMNDIKEGLKVTISDK